MLRAQVPSLLMNIGDTYHGGVEALYTQGEAVAAAVNALGIDVGMPGNWDYAYGHPMLVCGLTFLGADAMASGDSAAWTSAYRSLVETQAKALRAAGASVVVVMSELGLQKNYYLANAIAPGTVDVVFSAHTHEAVFTPLTSKSGALVVEAGDDTYVGHMDIRVANGSVTSRDWTLEPVTSAIPEDPSVKALVDAARAPFLAADPNLTIPGNTGAQYALHQAITTVVGTTPYPLTRKNSLDSSFNKLALRTRAQTTLGMAPGFRFDSPIPTSSSLVEGSIVADGSVTLEDAFRFFPVVYAMGTATVTGASLQTVLEGAMNDVFSADVPMQGGGWLEGFAGVRATVDLAAPEGQRVQSLALPDGAALDPGTAYTIAGATPPLCEDARARGCGPPPGDRR